MRGVILAGGTGSRLYPLTKVTNKHLLPVGRYPMIYHPLAKLHKAGIRTVMIVTGKEHLGSVVGLLGSGTELGLRLTYRVQDEAGGIAHALQLAEDFAADGSIVVILADNIFSDDLTPYLSSFQIQDGGAKVLLKAVNNPERFGVAELCNGKIVSIEEKPRYPKSNYCITGIYFYDRHVFDYISKLAPSARGELEITDLNNLYIERSKLTYDILPGFWTDAGTFGSLLRANILTRDLTYNLYEQVGELND